MSTVRVFEQETAIDASSPHVSLLHKIYEKSHLIPGSFVSRAPNAPESIWPDVSSRFNIPSHLFSEVFFKLYGFFWSGDVETENGNQKGHNICLRLLVKHAIEGQMKPNYESYIWHEMGFFTSWLTSNHTVIICYDAPLVFQEYLLGALLNPTRSIEYANPYFFQTLIIDAIIGLHDVSVQGLQKHIRRVEEARLLPRYSEPDYFVLHEIARHAIHSVETLNVAVDTITSMHDQYKSSMEPGGPRLNYSNIVTSLSTQSHMQFQIQLLRTIRSRSQGEIVAESLQAYNSVAQNDSRIMVQIGEAARADSAAMRMIAVVTMAFLPATFLSALFSMSFFDFTPGDGTNPETWSVSNKIWLYWIIVVPLTFLTMGTWFTWQRFGKMPATNHYHRR